MKPHIVTEDMRLRARDGQELEGKLYLPRDGVVSRPVSYTHLDVYKRQQWTGGKRIQLEREVPAHIGLRLAEMGHQVEICNSNLDMGRGQIIWRMEDGTLAGGTEPRCDGTVAAW